MDKRIRIGGIIAALIFSAVILTSPSDPPPIPEPFTDEQPNQFVEIIATNLENHGQLIFQMKGFSSVNDQEKYGS